MKSFATQGQDRSSCAPAALLYSVGSQRQSRKRARSRQPSVCGFYTRKIKAGSLAAPARRNQDLPSEAFLFEHQ